MLQARIDPLDATLSLKRVPLCIIDTGEAWFAAILPGNYLRLWPEYRPHVIQVMQLLSIMTGPALAVGCSNLATLLVARWTDRRTEIGVRRPHGHCGVSTNRP